MKLVEMKCKNCGSILKVDSQTTDITCEFCHSKFKIDDEVQHIKFDDMEQAGYEMEKGKLRARKEAKLEDETEKIKRNMIWWVLGWIFMFPIPLTILIWKSNWKKTNKILVTCILWGILLIIGYIRNDGFKVTQ